MDPPSLLSPGLDLLQLQLLGFGKECEYHREPDDYHHSSEINLASIQSSFFSAIILLVSPEDIYMFVIWCKRKAIHCISAKQINELKILVPLSCLYDL